MSRKFDFKLGSISFLLALSVAPISNLHATDASAEPLAQGIVQLPDFSPVVDKVKNAVVNVTTTQMVKANPYDMLQEFFGFGFPGMPQMEEQRRKMRPAQALGTGFVISEDGYIVTNNHVVEDAKEITVTFQDNSKAKAKVIGQDKTTDLALLKIDTKKKLVFAEWGDSDKMKVGYWVLALGYPFRLGLTLTKGVVSAMGRNIGGPFDDFIQTDAAINVGNSGGPLVDARTGQIIGINTAILSPSGTNAGIGFAIPSSTAKPIIEKLKIGEKIQRGWIGVAIDKVREDVAKTLGLSSEEGAIVVSVNESGPAKEAGVKPGDIILKFNGQPVKDDAGLVKAVAGSGIGKAAEMVVWRPNEDGSGGKEVTIKIKVADREKAMADGQLDTDDVPSKQNAKPNQVTIDSLGITFSSITPVLKEKYTISKKIAGVVVVEMDPMSPARGRLKVGDVITKVGQQPIKTPSDLKEAIEKNRKEGKTVLILWANRAGQENFITLPLPEELDVSQDKDFGQR